MIVSNLHKQPTALDTVVHRTLRLNNAASIAPVVAGFTSFMVTLAEFGEAGLDFPILFVNAGTDEAGKAMVAPVAVFGLKAGENLFVEDGKWMGNYMPAILRSYPFTMARIEQSDRWALVFDASWEGVRGDDGQPLFDAQGQATELLNGIHRFAQDIETDVERTRLACIRLQELNLLRPMRFDATLASGETLSVDGFMTLDDDVFGKLSDAQILELHRNGLLGLIHQHKFSLGNMRRLLNRRLAHQSA